MKKSIIIDSSSAILLYKSSLFEILLDKYNLCITKSVFSELSIEGYPGSNFFLNLNINIIEHTKSNLNNSLDKNLLKLDIGERDSLMLFHNGGFDFLIIDDGEGAKYCRKNKINYINALLVPKIFYFNKILNENEFIKKKDLIKSIGRYSREVINFAENCRKDDLILFFP